MDNSFTDDDEICETRDVVLLKDAGNNMDGACEQFRSFKDIGNKKVNILRISEP